MLKGKKTYVTGVVAIVAAVGAYLTGDMDAVTTAQSVFAALLAMFLRNGMDNG